MKVLVNAVSIKEGGPKVVLTKLLAAMQRQRPDIEWIVAANPTCPRDACSLPSVTWVPIPEIDRSALTVPLWYEFGLPKLVAQYRPSLLFSLTNYLPRRRLRCPTLLLVQHAGHFSSEFDRLTQEALGSATARMFWRLKGNWVRRSIRRADRTIVQTEALADSIRGQIARPLKPIGVVAHGPGFASATPTAKRDAKTDRPRIGYITKWGVQKNFGTLFDAARRLHEAGHRFRLVLTLDKDYVPAVETIDEARRLGIGDFVENHGELTSPGEIIALYDSLDIFVYPSLCESFGFPMVEAMARGLPIAVADTHENREITGKAGVVFQAMSGEDLAEKLAWLIANPDVRQQRSEMSLARAGAFSWDRAAIETLCAMDALVERHAA